MKFETASPAVEALREISWNFSSLETRELFPEALLRNPEKYFQEEGTNIKPGEVKKDESGRVREDPEAVKVFPEWIAPDGRTIRVVGKRVNVIKGKVGESGDPYHECHIIEQVLAVKLPAAHILATVTQGDDHFIFMEKIPGFGWYEREHLEAIPDIVTQANEMMEALRKRFTDAGIYRTWKLKDMVVLPDNEHGRILSMTPTDWERTTINEAKYQEYCKKN